LVAPDSESVVTWPNGVRCAYGNFSSVVYPSTTHWIRPWCAAGYGSLSTVSHGAAIVTLVFGSRLYIMREPSPMALLNRMFRSLLYAAKTSRLNRPLTGTPPFPSYRKSDLP